MGARHGGSRVVNLLARDLAGSTPQQLALANGFVDVARMIDERIAELEAKAACREQQEKDAMRASMRQLRVHDVAKRGMGTVHELEEDTESIAVGDEVMPCSDADE